MCSVKAPVKAVDHHRKMLLNLRANMRNFEGVAQSCGSKSALKNLELIGKFYHSLDDNLKSKLEAFLPSSQWSFQTFMVFSAGRSLTLMSCNAMKTRRSANDQDLFKVAMESIFKTNQRTTLN